MSNLFKSALLATTMMAGAASATTVEITVTNGQAAGGLYLTPLLSIFHDGSFDAFNAGSAASASVEALAEDGNFGLVQADAEGAGHLTQPFANADGFGGAPVLDPGEVTTIQVDLDTSSQRFFSFLSMVIPSNDTFIGNDNPVAYELFNSAGEFVFNDLIQVFAGDAWDGGTELDDGNGAPFTGPTGAGTVSTDQNGVIASLANLDFLIGRNQAPGGQVQSASGLLASISITEVAAVPLPAGLPLLLAGLGAFGIVRSRRKPA